MISGRAVVAHCWTGKPQSGWYPALKSDLAENGWSTRIPKLPETDTPHPAEWLSAFRKAVDEPDENTVLIGHSLGCATVLAYLQSLSIAAPLAGVVLVAPFSRLLNIAAIDAFHAGGFDWKKLRSRAEPKRVLMGAQDRYLADRLEEECLHFSRELGADVLLLGKGDHFSPASGRTRLPQATRLVLECLEVSGVASGSN